MADPNYNPNAALQTPGAMGGGYNPNPDPIIAASLNAPQGTISSSTLAPTSPITVPPATPDPSTNYASAIGSIDTIFNAANQPTAADQSQTQTKGALQSLYDRLLGRGASVKGDGSIDTTAAQTSAKDTAAQTLGYGNYADIANQLNSVNGQIQGLQKEALAIPLQLQQDATGRGITAAGLQPQQTALLRQNTIKALGLSSIAQTLQGNIARAEDMAAKAVEAEFLPYQTQLNYLQRQYDMNKDTLQREDAKRATYLQAQLNERQRLLDNAQEDKKTIYALAGAAMKNYPNDPSVQYAAQKAIQTNNLSTAYALVGQYQSDPLDTKQKIEQINLARAQQAKVYADISLTQAQRVKTLAETPTATNAKQHLQNNEALTLVNELLLPNTPGKHSAVGASLAKIPGFSQVAQATGLQGDRTAFEAKVNTLKANLTLDNLKLLKGAMSDKDLLFLNSVGSSLDTNMSEDQFDTELRRIKTKLESAGATAGALPTTQLYGPDGQLYNVPLDSVEAFQAAGGSSKPPFI